jgi:hypothetical protein
MKSDCGSKAMSTIRSDGRLAKHLNWLSAPQSQANQKTVLGVGAIHPMRPMPTHRFPAARNAGIEVPDKSIDRALEYFRSMTSSGGQVAYTGGLGGLDNSPARVSIATLVYSVSGRKDLKEFKAASSFLIGSDVAETSDHYGEYTAYYKAQALFQSDIDAWDKWNKGLIRELKEKQRSDGHFDGNYGAAVATAMNLLSIALNFRFLPIYER